MIFFICVHAFEMYGKAYVNEERYTYVCIHRYVWLYMDVYAGICSCEWGTYIFLFLSPTCKVKMSYIWPCTVRRLLDILCEWLPLFTNMIERSALKLGCLYIGGNAKLKCMTDDIQKIIKQHDVFAIVESWLDPKDKIPRVDGYVNFRNDRKKQSRAKKGIWWVNCVL